MFSKIYIKSLVVEGFKGYKERKVINFFDFTKVEGDNGLGKTSIGEAITWGFLGSNLWGNDKADGDLLNNSSKKMEVTIYFTDGKTDYTLKRERKHSATYILLNNRTVKQSDITAMLRNKEIFLSIFNPEYFSSRGDKDGRDFLVSILPDIPKSDILSKIDEFSIDYIKEDLDLIHANPNLYIKNKRAEVRELEKDLLFNEGVLSKLVTNTIIGDLKVFDLSRLEMFEKELEDLQIVNPELNNDEYRKLLEEKQNLETKIAVIKSKEFIKIDTLEDYKDLNKLEKDISLIEKDKYVISDDENKKLYTLEAEYQALRDEYSKKKNISLKEGDKCPTCRTSINHTHLEVLKEELNYELSYLADLGKDKAVELSNFKDSIESKRKSFETINKMKLKELKEKHDKILNKITETDKTNISNQNTFQVKKEESIKIIKDKISKIDNKIKFLEETHKSELESRLNQINLRKVELKDEILALKKEKAEIDAYNLEISFAKEKLEKDLVEKDKILKENDKIIKKMGLYTNQVEVCKEYTGVKVRLLSDIIHSHLNDVTIELQKVIKSTGELKDAFDIKYKGVDFKNVSRSEKMKVGLEISNLIRNITNFNYPLFFDNAESITRYDAPKGVQVIEVRVVEGSTLSINSKDNKEQLSIAL